MFREGKRFPVSAEWRVELTYRLVPNFRELDHDIVFKAAASALGGKGYSDGSGAGFGDRDHDWRVKDRATAQRLVSALKKAAKTLPSPRLTVAAPPRIVLDVAVPKPKPVRKSKARPKLAVGPK